MSVEDNLLGIGWKGLITWVGSPVSVPSADSASVVRCGMLGITTEGTYIMGIIK